MSDLNSDSGKPSSSSSRSSRSSRSKRAANRRVIFATCAILGLATGMFGVALWRTQPMAVPLGPDDAAAVQSIATKSSVTRESRLIYRHSVVPGGVQTPEELKRAIEQDPVVAAHYAGVNPATLRVAFLDEPRSAHVSYRIGDKVYWTRTRLELKAGERALTDGETIIRARCGNRVSADPLLPVAQAEPPAAEFDWLGTPSVMAALAPLGDIPAGTPMEFSAPPLGAVPSGGGGSSGGGSIGRTHATPGIGVPRSGGGGGGGTVPEAQGDVPPDPCAIPMDAAGASPARRPSGRTTLASGFISPDCVGSDSDPNPTGDPKPELNPTPDGDPNPEGDPDPEGDPGPKDPDPKGDPDPEGDPDPNPPPTPEPPVWNPETDAPVPVPEPTTLVLVGLGAAGGIARHLRNRRRNQQRL